MFGGDHQLPELMEEQSVIPRLTVGFGWDRCQWNLESSRKTNAVQAIIEARTIGM
jgi:hypothetical protein